MSIISGFRKELSTGQVDKPINTKALTSWAEHIPEDVKRDMDILAPMLKTLGYNPDLYPPNYGTPDKQVLKNSQLLARESEVRDSMVFNDNKMGIHRGDNINDRVWNDERDKNPAL